MLAILSFVPLVYDIPGDPEAIDNPIIMFKWKKLWEEQTRDKRVWTENNKKIYSLTLQHCTPELQEKIK